MNTSATTVVSIWPYRVRSLAARLGVLLLALAGSASAAVRVESTGGPFYARIERDLVYTDGVWAAIPLYRPADCIPADFNLLDFFDFAALGCPSYVAGFEVWKDFSDPAPIQSELKAVEPMPILFVRWEELEAAMDDDVLTIGELLALPSLEIGQAAFYQETQHPTLPGRQAVTSVVSHGVLEDGTRFRLNVVENDYVLKHISIQFD